MGNQKTGLTTLNHYIIQQGFILHCDTTEKNNQRIMIKSIKRNNKIVYKLAFGDSIYYANNKKELNELIEFIHNHLELFLDC